MRLDPKKWTFGGPSRDFNLKNLKMKEGLVVGFWGFWHLFGSVKSLIFDIFVKSTIFDPFLVFFGHFSKSPKTSFFSHFGGFWKKGQKVEIWPFWRILKKSKKSKIWPFLTIFGEKSPVRTTSYVVFFPHPFFEKCRFLGFTWNPSLPTVYISLSKLKGVPPKTPKNKGGLGGVFSQLWNPSESFSPKNSRDFGQKPSKTSLLTLFSKSSKTSLLDLFDLFWKTLKNPHFWTFLTSILDSWETPILMKNPYFDDFDLYFGLLRKTLSSLLSLLYPHTLLFLLYPHTLLSPYIWYM